ncbi:MAG: hypothetical protein ACI9VR_005133 [Cognaticolwellia sp.]|jgi:hypothetical protein
MAQDINPDLALFLHELSSEEVQRLLVYLNGQTTFAKEQAGLAAKRAAVWNTPLAWAAVQQCEQYWQDSWQDLQILLSEVALRTSDTTWEN